MKKDIKILIAEDEGDICLLLNLMLKKDNTDIEHANSLAKTTELLETSTPDILILDNNLPDGLGVDYIVEVKAKYPSIKIVMISGNTEPEDKERAFKNGANVFLGKPFTKAQMQHTLEGLSEVTFS